MPRGSELLGTPAPAPAAPAPRVTAAAAAAKPPATAPAPARVAPTPPRAPAPAPTPRKPPPAAARPAAPAAKPAPAPEPQEAMPAPPASAVDNYAEFIGAPGVERREAFGRMIGAPEVGEPQPGTEGLSRAYERRMRIREAAQAARKPKSRDAAYAGEPVVPPLPPPAKGELMREEYVVKPTFEEVELGTPYRPDPYAVVTGERVTVANPADVVKPSREELQGFDEVGGVTKFRDRAKSLEEALRAVKAERRSGEMKVDKIEERVAQARKTGAPDQDRLAAQASGLNAAMRVLRQRQANVARSLGEYGYSPDEVKSIE